MYDIVELNKKLVTDLREIAVKLKIDKADKLKKEELVYKILDQQAISPIKEEKNNSDSKGDNKEKSSKAPSERNQKPGRQSGLQPYGDRDEKGGFR